jgi:hypothetical protein
MLNTYSRGLTHRSLTDTDGGYKLRGAGFSHTTLRPCNIRVTLFSNYLHYKLNQASSVMINQVIKVQDQDSKLGVRI